ncbi:DNA repair protein RadC [Ruminococcus sp. OA3]|uniref:RadC family protein n=1 Tax=Ruminococcus sp. OA3 TaxID=2914164 RepID=UPI001F062EDA|nr:DNA repair protein RadC [Ruminococcus sp. OA3]MCH1983321.1 DNA repair protein RadC [Ruminococcus sp. OA3]
MKKHETIKKLPVESRPYEKFRLHGAQSLTDAELLAIILRSGTHGTSSIELAQHLLALSKGHEGLLGLHHLSLAQLTEVKGIGDVKAVQIKCIGELSRRIAKGASSPFLDFKSPDTIADYYMEDLRHQEQEVLLCMMLDTKNHFLGDVQVSKGTVNASLISPREIFLSALQFHAVHIILVHNHPSGNPRPSNEDILITKRILEAGELLGIYLLDHIIIGDRRHISLCQEGMIQRA